LSQDFGKSFLAYDRSILTVHGVGVVLDSFGQPPREALRLAAELAFREVEMPVVSGEVEPNHLSHSGRRHLARYVTGLGLHLAALGGDIGGSRLADSAALEERLDRVRRIMELAAQLRVPVVTSHLGTFDRQSLEKGHLPEAIRWLADMADRIGTRLAFETGGADPELTANLLNEVDCPLLGVCYDPAALLIDGFDPLAGLPALADRILIARARDALAGSGQHPGRESALGYGQIDLQKYLVDLEAAGYHGLPFLRRLGAKNPLDELREAKKRLHVLLGR
jgi:sugar phosphate isomerase/epimerase